jgi:hypothetical protein
MTAISKDLVYMDEGAFLASFTYDDLTLQMLAVHVENNSERDYVVSATATATGRDYVLTIPPGVIDQPIPQDTVNKLQLSVRANGRLDGVEWSVS